MTVEMIDAPGSGLSVRRRRTSVAGLEESGLLVRQSEEVARRLEEIPDSKRWWKSRNKQAVYRRRDMPIRAYVGPNGSFKSATMILDILPTLRGIKWHCEEPSHLHNDPIYDEHGNPIACGPDAVHDGYRFVLSTVAILDPGTGEHHPLYRRLTEWWQFMAAEHCDIVLDEVTGIANARDAMGLPRPVQTKMDQMRKLDDTLSFSAPSFQRADATLRTTCQGIVDCRGYMSEKRQATVSAWRRRRLARVRTFSALDLEQFTAGAGSIKRQKNHRLRPESVQWWWGPGSEVFLSYSSKGAVSRVGQVSDGGVCIDCGGTRTRHKCSCDDTH